MEKGGKCGACISVIKKIPLHQLIAIKRGGETITPTTCYSEDRSLGNALLLLSTYTNGRV